MLEISPEKIAHVIIRAREYDSGVNAWAHSGQRRGHGTETELAEFIAALNEDEQASLVAVMWIGRDTFGAEDLAEFREARGDWGVRIARRLGRTVRVHDVPPLDHALLAASGRAEVRTMLRDMLVSDGRDGDRAAPTASGDAETTS